MRGLVGEERELREDDAEGGGHEQLEPAVAEQPDAEAGRDEGDGESGADEGVEPAGPPEQTRLLHDP